MNPTLVAQVLGAMVLGHAALAPAHAVEGTPFASPAVRALADQLRPAGARAAVGADGALATAPVGEEQAANLCSQAAEAGDLTEALMLAGVDVFTAVRDTILACSRQGTGPEVAAQAATRALLTQGRTARPLIDAAVLAAAAEIERRRRGAAVAARAPAAAADQSSAQRDLERERLERMMQKGLIDDEYRRYIDERRNMAERAFPDPAGTGYAERDAEIYSMLYTQALVGSGFLDRTLDQRADPGGFASSQ